jgi:hypothetical protein
MVERGLLRCALWVAKARGSVNNMKLVTQILRIVLKLLKGIRSRIVRAGQRRGKLMSEAYERTAGALSWSPWVREWFHDRRYVWYLGVLEVTP